MIQVYKETFSEHQVYRYRFTDDEERLLYLAEPTGLFLPNPTRQITLFSADGLPIGWIEPPDPSRWPWGGNYTVFLKGKETPLAVITEQWELVDLLLLRLPRYLFQWEGNPYIARGNRFGERFYEIFHYLLEAGEGLSEDTSVEISLADLDPARLQEMVEKEALRWGDPVGVIWRSTRGPHYRVEALETILQSATILMTTLVVLADLHLQEQNYETIL